MKQIIQGLVPSKSNGYKIGQSGLFKTKVLTAYESAFYLQCNHYRNKNIDGFFELHLEVYYPNMRSDLDGCLKIILDCLQKCKAVKNDNRAVKIIAQKFVDKTNPRIEFEIKEV